MFQSIADIFFTYALIVLIMAIMAAALFTIYYVLSNIKPSFNNYDDAA